MIKNTIDWGSGLINKLQIKLSTKLDILNKIYWGYRSLIFSTPSIEALYQKRKVISDIKCNCSDWYLKFKLFGKEYKFFEYCNECGCIKQAKFRCEECNCPKGNW